MEEIGEYLKAINDNIIVVIFLLTIISVIILSVVNVIKWAFTRFR